MGLAGFGALSMTDLLRARAEAKAAPDTAIILVWLHGGASHLETYDPKPEAPSEYRGPFGTIKTNVPGIEISELLPRQAKLADKYALIRSIAHRGFCHQQGLQTLLTGHQQLVLKQKPDHPDLFCIGNKIRQRPDQSMPPYVGIPPLPYGGAAYLGPSAEPFIVSGDPNAPKFSVPNIGLKDPKFERRVHRRLALRDSVDEMRRDLDGYAAVRARDPLYDQALSLLTDKRVARAFDITQEPDRMRDRYGRHRWGQQLLLARRLVENGVSLITSSFFGIEKGMSSNWDDHAVNWDCFKAMKERAPVFDQAVAALIEDLHERGLDKRVMVVVTGEFGRTPKISYTKGRPGRDHWPRALSLLISGGGIKTGQVIGATTPTGEDVDERLIHPNDLLATMYRHLGIDTHLQFKNHKGQPIPILDRSAVIEELV